MEKLSNLHKISALYGLPDFVKEAQYEDDSQTILPSTAYAAPWKRAYPCHTKAATYLSNVAFWERAVSESDEEDVMIGRKLLEFADEWNIKPEVSSVMSKIAQDRRNTVPKFQDSDYALVVDNGASTDRKYLLVDDATVKIAADVFTSQRNLYPYEWRKEIANKILEKAAQFHCDLNIDSLVYLQKAAGIAPSNSTQAVVDQIELRAATLGGNDTAKALYKLANEVKTRKPSVEFSEKTAAMLDAVDTKAGFFKDYISNSNDGYKSNRSGYLQLPEEFLYSSPTLEKHAQDEYVTLQTGTTFDKATLKQAGLKPFKLIPDYIDSVTSMGQFDVDKAAEVLPTIPRDEALLLEKAITASGVKQANFNGGADVTQPIKPLLPQQRQMAAKGVPWDKIGKRTIDISTTKAADVSHDVYSQMPGFHPVDTAVGALAGAGGGMLYDKLKGSNGDKHSKLRRILSGAAIGGLGADLAGDRARRYISNVPNMTGYDSESVLKRLVGHGVKGVVDGAILDKPIKNDMPESDAPTFGNPDPSKSDGWSDALKMRREFIRRGMGVHTNDPNDYFQDTGTIRGSDGKSMPHVQLSERFTDPATGMLKNDSSTKSILKSLVGDLRPEKADKYPGWNISNTLGSYSVDRPASDVARARDYFNYSLEPDNQKRLAPLASELLQHPSHYKDDVPENINNEFRVKNDTKYNKGEYLSSLISRLFMDNVVTHKPAVFDSTFKYDPATGLPTQQFSNITHDQGVTKDDEVMKRNLAPFTKASSISGDGVGRPVGGSFATPSAGKYNANVNKFPDAFKPSIIAGKSQPARGMPVAPTPMGATTQPIQPAPLPSIPNNFGRPVKPSIPNPPPALGTPQMTSAAAAKG